MIRKYCLDIYPVDLYISTIDCFEEMKRKFLFYPTIKDLLNKENNGSPISPVSADGVTFIVRDKEPKIKEYLYLQKLQINQMVQLQKQLLMNLHTPPM